MRDKLSGTWVGIGVDELGRQPRAVFACREGGLLTLQDDGDGVDHEQSKVLASLVFLCPSAERGIVVFFFTDRLRRHRCVIHSVVLSISGWKQAVIGWPWVCRAGWTYPATRCGSTRP